MDVLSSGQKAGAWFMRNTGQILHYIGTILYSKCVAYWCIQAGMMKCEDELIYTDLALWLPTVSYMFEVNPDPHSKSRIRSKISMRLSSSN